MKRRNFAQHIFSCFIYYIDSEKFDDDSICITTQFCSNKKKNNNKNVETDKTKKEVMCDRIYIECDRKRECIMFREKLYPIHMIVIIIMYII